MSLTKSPVFIEYMERATAEAINTALEADNQSVAEILLVDRFGSLDQELLAIVPNVIKLSKSEFMPLLLHMNREELVNCFTHPSDIAKH